MKKQILMMVGPTVLPDAVIEATNCQVISHRGAEFSEISKRLNENLKKVVQTKNEVMTLTSSGTGSMEAAVQNCFSVGDEVVVSVCGVFSERMADIAETYGLKVIRVVSESGEAADVATVMAKVTPQTKGVFIVQNESSTGVMNDIEAFGKAVKDTQALLVVDAVSALGGIDLQMDNWHVDVVFASSQKALMCSPGLAVIALSDKAWKAAETSNIPTYYFDLKRAKKMWTLGQHPWTPAVYQILALYESTNIMLEEGMPNIFARHKKLSKMVIEGMDKLGLKLYPKNREYASITVNTFAFDRSVEFVKRMSEEHDIVIGGGQDYLHDTTFRVGTMGYISENDVNAFLAAAKEVLDEMK